MGTSLPHASTSCRSRCTARTGDPPHGGVLGAGLAWPGATSLLITEYLQDRFGAAEVHAVFSRYGYSPADDSPFANRVFDPAAVDDFFSA
jgi:L-ornithine N5-oxygenase